MLYGVFVVTVYDHISHYLILYIFFGYGITSSTCQLLGRNVAEWMMIGPETSDPNQHNKNMVVNGLYTIK